MTTADLDRVDPEMRVAVTAFGPLALDAERLGPVRDAMAQALAAAPDAAPAFPGVLRAEHRVPGIGDAPDVRVLVYTPAAPGGPTGALVWMHGGGYVFGSADDSDALCRRLTAETGAVCVSVDYRLAPETPAPGPLDDADAALRWVLEHADDLGVDPARVAVGGASAGGGLAACLAVRVRDRGGDALAAQLLVYPMLDDRTGSTYEPPPHVGHLVWTAADNRFGWTSLLGREPGGADVPAEAAAARVASAAGLPPTFLAVGDLDLFADEDVAFAARLMRDGVPVELHVHPGAYHGFEMAVDARATLRHQTTFADAVRRHVGGKEAV